MDQGRTWCATVHRVSRVRPDLATEHHEILRHGSFHFFLNIFLIADLTSLFHKSSRALRASIDLFLPAQGPYLTASLNIL